MLYVGMSSYVRSRESSFEYQGCYLCLFVCFVILDKSPKLCDPQLLHLCNENNNTY